ncbi:MAG: NAD(+) synthase [Myxococcota bacterium]|nr:NAD(+) synthase [Myxococcota bacterium]
MMNPISKWLFDYAQKSGERILVVGVSGGVDSAVTSTLCGETGINTFAVSLPIHQEQTQLTRATRHLNWLEKKYPNVTPLVVDLSDTFDCFAAAFSHGFDSALGLANARSRLRMAALYQIAASQGGLVVGTGNRVEDFGVGFFTKYGDGGVDVSPIGDLLKSEVRQLARGLGILTEIIDAPPTDGLWEDNRTDEDQLGATYDELEWAMAHEASATAKDLTSREAYVLQRYRTLRAANLHKMVPIPVYKKPDP